MIHRPFLLFTCIALLAGCSTHKHVAASHPNGKPEVVIYMKGEGEDAVKVMEKVYYPSGKLEYVGRFENGVEHGIHYDYSPDGQIYRELHYEKGRLVKEVDRSKPE